MKNISSIQLIKLLSKYGYELTRQKGSHIRLNTTQNGQHHIMVPKHDPVKIGTLSAINKDVGEHFGYQKEK